MQKLFIFLILSNIHIASVWCQTECRPANYMLQSVANIVSKILTANSASEYGLDDGVCVLGTYLSTKSKVKWNISMEEGEEYLIIGGGDDDVTDLDIYVEKASGTVLAKDNEHDNRPAVFYKCKESATITIKLDLYGSKAAGSFVSMVVMKKGGYNVSKDNFVNASVALFANIVKLCKSEVISGMSFLSTDNNWSLFGGVVEKGSTIGVQNVGLSTKKPNVILGGSDQNADDIDLYLKDSNGNTLESDVRSNKTPLVIHEGRTGEKYTISLKNSSGAEQPKRSLGMMAILEVTLKD